jgi:hypothetical protein
LRVKWWLLEGLCLGALTLGCGAEESAPAASCDETIHRAVLTSTPGCPSAEFITVGAVDVFRYEASHPTATADRAFPCAASQGQTYEAPAEATPASSTRGVRPWPTVRHSEASAACEAAGWRLCTSAELIRGCAGPAGDAHTYGAPFDGSACNVRDAFRAEGADFASEAPTGHFTQCESAEGGFDLSGNLREWVAAEGEVRRNQGGGWRTVAEAHRESNLRCDSVVTVPAFSAAVYASPDVGFRCCRDH